MHLNIIRKIALLLPTLRSPAAPLFHSSAVDQLPFHPKSESTMVTVLHETSAPCIGIKLNSHNFSTWAQVAKMCVAGRGKIGYLTGTKKEPEETDVTYEK